MLFESHTEHVAEFKLNHQKALNSLDPEMIELMVPHLKNWNAKPESAPRAVLISGTGGKAFCAGGDIVAIYKAERQGSESDKKIKSEFFAREYLLDYSLAKMAPL